MIELDPEIAKAFRSSVNISSKYSFLELQQRNQPIFALFLATKGRGVHILKPGSKRRRTQADMEDQLAFDDVVQADLKKSKSKVQEQKTQIENLESQLNTLQEEANEDRGAAKLIRDWADQGLVQLDSGGRPNVVGNAEDQVEEPMQVFR